jgi:hypothetical protein
VAEPQKTYSDAPLTEAQAKGVGYEDIPTSWTTKYPKTAAVARAVTSSLPAVGGIVGGVVSAGPTGGVGTIPGMALGAGVGRGAQDLIDEYTGLQPKSSAGAKGARIGLDTALTATTGKALEAGGDVYRMLRSNPKATVGDFLDLILHPLKHADQVAQSMRASGPKPAPSVAEPWSSAGRPLYEMMDELPRTAAPAIPRAGGPIGQEVGTPTPFNELPVFRQQASLPTRGPMPQGARTVAPPISEFNPNDVPLFRQMESLPTSGAAPLSGGRVGMPPANASDAQFISNMITDVMEKATSPSARAPLSQWESEFVSSLSDQLKAGRPLSGNQKSVLYRIFGQMGAAR